MRWMNAHSLSIAYALTKVDLLHMWNERRAIIDQISGFTRGIHVSIVHDQHIEWALLLMWMHESTFADCKILLSSPVFLHSVLCKAPKKETRWGWCFDYTTEVLFMPLCCWFNRCRNSCGTQLLLQLTFCIMIFLLAGNFITWLVIIIAFAWKCKNFQKNTSQLQWCWIAQKMEPWYLPGISYVLCVCVFRFLSHRNHISRCSFALINISWLEELLWMHVACGTDGMIDTVLLL